LLQLSPASGSGDGTIDVSLPLNRSGRAREYRVIVGSGHAVVRQASSLDVQSIDPAEGTPAGGTAVTIIGNGFAAGASVTFGGQLATSVVVVSSSVIHALTPAGVPGPVDIEVRNSSGLNARLLQGFTYASSRETTVDLRDAAGVFGRTADLRATLIGASGPLARRLLSFFVANVHVGTATTGPSGRATLRVALGRRPAGSYPVRVEFQGDTTSGPASATATLSIRQAPLTLRANHSTKRYGQALPAFSVTPIGLMNGDSIAALSGTLTFHTTASASSAPGWYAVTPAGVSSPNYRITFVAGTLRVRKAKTTVSLSSRLNPSRRTNDYDLRAAVSVMAPGAGSPTGWVSFHQGREFLGAAPVRQGIAAITVTIPRRGSPMTATYSGDLNFGTSSDSESTASSTRR
jgi:hypothetical protein